MTLLIKFIAAFQQSLSNIILLVQYTVDYKHNDVADRGIGLSPRLIRYNWEHGRLTEQHISLAKTDDINNVGCLLYTSDAADE